VVIDVHQRRETTMTSSMRLLSSIRRDAICKDFVFVIESHKMLASLRFRTQLRLDRS
jgi:hypothetical protein